MPSEFLSGSDMSDKVIGITECVLTFSSFANDVKNSLSVSSCPYHCNGFVPASSAAYSLERLLKETPLCMIPFLHGDAAAALKEFLLYQSKFNGLFVKCCVPDIFWVSSG